MNWKKGRGKLGILEPLLGTWETVEQSEDRMNVKCIRTFSKTLQGKYIQLKADWHLPDKVYEDMTLFGVNANKEICFWSFQSDGKQSRGQLAKADDIHKEAICFEAQMPGGLARQVYWPSDTGIHWVVESKTKKGWNNIVTHHYSKQSQ